MKDPRSGNRKGGESGFQKPPEDQSREEQARQQRARRVDRARLVLDRSASGAPAAGRVVRDLFSTDEIFQRLVHTADEEFSRPARLLFLSGLAAGMAISFSFVGSAMLAGQTGSIALGHLMYPLGFLIVVMGRTSSSPRTRSCRSRSSSRASPACRSFSRCGGACSELTSSEGR